ncbi:MAG TPA: TonB-dependent receptor [Bryobacteraceae bacterium]|nr:TonB-dependent receptor [Bryobacteraceae bacterium]
MLFRSLLFVFLLSISLAPAQDTTGTGAIYGVVNDSQRQPAAGVRVCIESIVRCATSATDGRFRIEGVRAGAYQLTVSLPGGGTAAAAAVEVRAGLEHAVEVMLPSLDAGRQSVTVSESVFVTPEEVKNSGFLIQPREIFKSAGALQDVSRYIQTLPGVAIGSDDFRNDIIVRGGSPLENLFIVDNIEIPNINAFANFASAGGSVSILDAALIQDITFLTGGYPAPFINRASSVLQVAQREGSRDRLTGRATLGFAGSGTVLEGPLAKGKGSWIVSARRTFLDLITDDVGFGGVPVVYTFNAKAVYDLTPRDRVWAVGVSGVDRIRLGQREGTEDVNDDEVFNFDIRYQGWRSATGLNWQRLFGSRGVGLLGISHSEASVGQTVRDLVRNGVPPAGVDVPQLIANSPLIFEENSREGESTVKYDLTTYASRLGKLQAGGSWKVFRIGYNTASPLGFDSPYSVFPGTNPFGLRRNFLAYQTGGYMQTTANVTSRLSLTAGGRFDNYSYLGESRLSPRAALSYRLTDKLSWRASYGSYYQQPFFVFLAAFPVNAGLVPFRADHYVTGFSYLASRTLRFSVETYRKIYRDYPVALQFPQLSLANIGDTFDVRSILFPLTSAGRGRAQGIELFMEKKFSDKWFGQANLAFSRTRHSGLDGALRPGSFDYPFIANGVGGYRLNPRWELSARAAWLGGRPFTPFLADQSQVQRRGIFDLARVNGERLPDYFRLDLRVDRTFTVRDKPLLVFAGFQNITNRNNVGGYTWNRRTNAVEENEQLGIFPLIGLDWRF